MRTKSEVKGNTRITTEYRSNGHIKSREYRTDDTITTYFYYSNGNPRLINRKTVSDDHGMRIVDHGRQDLYTDKHDRSKITYSWFYRSMNVTFKILKLAGVEKRSRHQAFTEEELGKAEIAFSYYKL